MSKLSHYYPVCYITIHINFLCIDVLANYDLNSLASIHHPKKRS